MITDKTHKELNDKIWELCQEYPELSLVVIINDDNDDNMLFIAGNACPVCAAGHVMQLYTDGRIKHSKDELTVLKRRGN